MKALITLTAATLGLLMVTSARAQEPMWTGCNIGVGVGMGAVETNVRFGSFRENLGGMNALGSAGVGCDMEIPDTNLLVGAFADYTWLGITSSNSLGKIDYDSQVTVGGRLGTFLTPRTLAYVLAGYSKMDTGGLRVLGKNVGGIGDFSGFVVGGGLETDIGNNLRLGVEGRYYDYDSDSAKFYGKPISVDPDVQTVQVRLKWQLWTPVGLAPIPLK